MSKKRLQNNPKGFWGTSENGWSPNTGLIVYLLETRYPDFLPRIDIVTSEMTKEVTRLFNKFTGSNQDWLQIDIPLRSAVSKRTEWSSEKYDWNDDQYRKYKKELKNK